MDVRNQVIPTVADPSTTMKKIDLNQGVNTLANLGVIAGIVFLALEINQNSEMMRAQTRNEVANALTNCRWK
jgi:hypothetical protein